MEIYEDQSPSEYNRYLEITDLFQQQVLNFKIDDDLGIILLPLVEKMRQPVGIEDSKIHNHLKNVKEAVDFDRYIEFILDTYLQLQEERKNQIRDIFLASDLNGDRLISYSEFYMLMKVFLYKSQIDIQTFFDDYSSGDQDSQNKDSKYLNLKQFIQLCQDKEYFTTKVQQNFCQSKNIVKDFKKLTDTLPQTVLLFKARLREVNMHEDAESLELIENFQNCVKFPFSDNVGWLCYRIVYETFKRLFTKKLSDRYLPVDMKKLSFKIKPSQSLFGLTALNLFDTL